MTTTDLLGEMKHGHADPIADRHYAWAVAEITSLRQKISALFDEASYADLRASGGLFPAPAQTSQVTDAMVERAWAAIVGSDVASICFQASIIRADLKTGLQAALAFQPPAALALASEERHSG